MDSLRLFLWIADMIYVFMAVAVACPNGQVAILSAVLESATMAYYAFEPSAVSHYAGLAFIFADLVYNFMIGRGRHFCTHFSATVPTRTLWTVLANAFTAMQYVWAGAD